jgi:hypothetical protein
LSSLRMRLITFLPRQQTRTLITIMERLAGVEPAISALATQRLTARLQPLINWLREGDSNPNHPRFQRPLSCH